MKIHNQVNFVAFLLAISTLTTSTASATEQFNSSESQSLNIEQRLSRLTNIIKQQPEINDPLSSENQENLTAGWFNGGGGGWLNTSGGGFLNNRGGGGGFYNRRWPDGGSFFNRPWSNGGSFFNRF
jgi:rSAM-associated Gly-rich repeat protein